MELGWGALVFLMVCAAVAWFWQDSLAARERANEAAMQACQDLGLQFLDGTVAFARIALTRTDGGWLTFRRTYIFDYTADSIDRRQGFVVLVAHRIESVGYAQDPAHRHDEREVSSGPFPEETSPKTHQPARGANGSNVLKLDDWRSRRGDGQQSGQHRHEGRGDRRH